METRKQYPALIFRQRSASQVQVAFAAPSAEVDEWARVPTKNTGNIRNFQRAEIPKHVGEVTAFFKSAENTSPTALVVGFDPLRAATRIKLLAQDKVTELLEKDVGPGTEIQGAIEISWQADPDATDREGQLRHIEASRAHLKEVVYAELVELSKTSTEALDLVEKYYAEHWNRDLPATTQVAEDEEDLASGTEGETEIPDTVRELLAGLSPSEQQVVAGRISFVAQTLPEVLRMATDEDVESIYKEIRNELKPGLLIDGQHRVHGTKKLGRIPFLVMALPFATWPELAFQFIVTNRTARRVPESLLISIVGNSLSRQQRATMEERLREASIRVGLIEAVMQIHEDPTSPFFGMLSFGLKNDPGILDAAAMRGKVVQPWFERQPPIQGLFDHLCPGRKKSERTDYWKNEALWFEYLVAFWDAVRERYEGSAVFSKATIVKKGKVIPAATLMRATVLMIFQHTVLENIFEHVGSRQRKDGVKISESLPDHRAFSDLVKRTLLPLTPDFFEGWELDGFDGSANAREDLENAINLTLDEKRSVAVLKKGTGRFPAHRLFLKPVE